MPDKIISLQQRRQLNLDVAAFAETTNERQLMEAARRIVRSYPANQVLALLLRLLDTPSSQLRGGLGHLAALLPPDEVVPALRSAAANRHHSAHIRTTAALILERFLGESLPHGALGDLIDTNEVAFQSLREAVELARRHRHVLLEYVTQMRQTDADIAFMVMDLLARLDPHDQVDLLRLIALDDRPPVAERGLERLVALAATEAREEVARALTTLQFTLPPRLAEQAQRSLRKLQFAGAQYAPPAADGWRALLGPADVFGNQSVWLVRMPGVGDAHGVLLGLVLNVSAGLLHAFGDETAAPEVLPLQRSIGKLVPVRTDTGDAAVLMEAPFEFGRWLILQAAAAHWRSPELRPLPGDYRLYSDLIWQFGPPQPEASLPAFFVPQPAVASADASAPDAEELAQAVARLLEHPAMAGWFLNQRAIVPGVDPALNGPEMQAPGEVIAHTLRVLEQWPEHPHLLASLEAGLRTQAAWLYLLGSVDLAQSARQLADSAVLRPPTQNPLLAALLERGLQAKRPAP